MSDPVSTAPKVSNPQSPAPVLPKPRSGYLTSTFGMTLAAITFAVVLVLKDKLDPAVAGVLLLVLPGVYGFLRKERALGHAEINADLLTGAAAAAAQVVIASRAPALAAAMEQTLPDLSGQARASSPPASPNEILPQQKERISGDANAPTPAPGPLAATGGASDDEAQVVQAGRAAGATANSLLLLVGLGCALSGCSHVESVSVGASGNRRTGDLSGQVTVSLRDPALEGLSK